MNSIQTITHYFVASLSVLLSFGLFAHDSHAEKFYMAVTSGGASSAYAEAEQQIPQKIIEDIRGGQHAHVAYNPLSGTFANSFAYQSPSLAPRRDSHHKQLLRLIEESGRHAFDNANLPIMF
ncbi:MAG: hypothetical protein ABIP74_03240 [Candidatus Saccharimonas sp.]